MAINDLIVLIDDSIVPFGYNKINHDLNEGAGGRYLYFAFHPGNQNPSPITDIQCIYGDSSSVGDSPDLGLPRAPSGQPYTKLGTDLNMGAGGRYIYACITRDPSAGTPITAIDVISGDSANIQPHPPFRRDDLDLNLGSGGKYIYLVYSRA